MRLEAVLLSAVLVGAIAPGAWADEIRIRLAGSGDGPGYANDPAPRVRSMSAVIDDLDVCRILTLCISDVPNLTCTGARSLKPTGRSFVLMVGVRLAKSVSPEPGRWEDVGVILRSVPDRYAAHGNLGYVLIEQGGPSIRGRLAIQDARFSAMGDFVADLEPEP